MISAGQWANPADKENSMNKPQKTLPPITMWDMENHRRRTSSARVAAATARQKNRGEENLISAFKRHVLKRVSIKDGERPVRSR